MAYTTINKSTDYFNTVTYTGNGSTTQTITGVGFQPDWVWLKNRSTTNDHNVYDVVRGSSKRLEPNNTNAEVDIGSDFTFQSDGFYVGDRGDTNGNGNSQVAWNWKAGGSGSANTDGTINTTSTSVNTTAGFSISKYTATGNNATVGHGLGAVPKMIIIKDLEDSGGSNWGVYHNSIGNTNFLELNTTAALDTSIGLWNNTTPTSSVFSIGTNDRVNNVGNDFIAYCFAEKTGYSKFGSYVGNGNANGTFVYTGFKPAFVMVKASSDTSAWYIYDNKRAGYNVKNYQLYPNVSNAEGTTDQVDLLSNGFKWRDITGDPNSSGRTYIYMAIGQSLVGSNNIPCTAR